VGYGAWITSALSLSSIALPLQAGDLTVALGSYLLAGVDTEVNVKVNGLGGSFSPQDALGLETDTAVARFNLDYAFNADHMLSFSYYRINSTGEVVLDQDIDWPDDNGNIISAGSGIRTHMGYRILRASYRWNFYHNDKVELGIGAGLHLTEVSLGLDTRVISGGETLYSEARRGDVTMPLPVLGVHLGYRINPRWDWQIDSEWFTLRFDRYQGSYLDSTLTLGYRLTPRLRAGIGIAANSLDLREDDGTTRLDIRNDIDGGLVYLGYRF